MAYDRRSGRSWAGARDAELWLLAATLRRRPLDVSRGQVVQVDRQHTTIFAPCRARCGLTGRIECIRQSSSAKLDVTHQTRKGNGMSAWQPESRTLPPDRGPRRLPEPGRLPGPIHAERPRKGALVC